MSIRKVYTSGPYTSTNPEQVEANVAAANVVGLQVRSAGFVPMVPHAAVIPGPGLTWELAMEECLVHLSDCHACLMFGDWQKSKGAREELAYAEHHGIPVFYSLQELCSGLEARP